MAGYPRLNIYLDHDLRKQVKIAAAQRNISISAYCVEAIRERLATDAAKLEAVQVDGRNVKAKAERIAAAQALDELRCQLGPIGVTVSELIAAGRRR
jgi:hypothetical protein